MDPSDWDWRGADSPDSDYRASSPEPQLDQDDQDDFHLFIDLDQEATSEKHNQEEGEEGALKITDDADVASEITTPSPAPCKPTTKKRKTHVTDYFKKNNSNNESVSNTDLQVQEPEQLLSKRARGHQGKSSACSSKPHPAEKENGPDQSEPGLEISDSDREIIASSQAIIWRYFTRIDKRSAKCNECAAMRSIPTGTTTTLAVHLRKHFGSNKEYLRLKALKDKYLACEKQKGINKKGGTITLTKMLKIEYMDPKSKKALEITHAITIWVCKNLHPYSIVEEPEFIDLIRLLEPRYKVPCRTTFSRSIITKLYISLKAIEKAYFSLVMDTLESINATTDMWTSTTAKDSYIALTIQFVDSECELVSMSVECEPFPGIHDGKSLLHKVEWMLAEKLGLRAGIENQPDIYITADNGPNIAAALAEPTDQRMLDPKVPPELKKKRMWFYIRCMNHTLQLAISDARKDMNAKTVIEKVQLLAVRYSRSKNAREDLKRFQNSHKLPEHEILLDCETRWNSEYIMMSRFLEQKAAITSELAHAGEENLSTQEWRLVEGYVQVLKPIFDHTAQLGSSKEVTFSTVLPVLYEIKSSLEEFIRTAAKGAGIMFARKILSKLEERFPDEDYKDNSLYQVGMLVDPRFKDILISSYEGDKTGHFLLERFALEKHRRHIRRGLLQKEDTSTSKPLPTAIENNRSNIKEKKSRFSHLAKIGQNRADLSSSCSADVTAAINTEVESYLGSKTEDEDCNPLQWWKHHKQDYPHIYPLARHYLGLAPTEVPSERVFSVGGNTCTKKRSRLLPDHVKEIIYIHDNYDMLMRLSKLYNLK